MKNRKKQKFSVSEMLGLKKLENIGLFYTMPMLHINCAGEVVIENSKGIKTYTPNEICLDMGEVAVSIKGDGMIMQALDKTKIVINGRFFSFEILYGGAKNIG